MTNYEIMTNQFNEIKKHKKIIKKIESSIKPVFEEIVIDFFKSKNIKFDCTSNKWDVVRRYKIKNGNTSHHFYHLSNYPGGENYFPPKFKITPWEFTIRFEWWKTMNSNMTRCYWHPEEQTLEEFYNKKLKKVFDLLKDEKNETVEKVK